MSDLYVMLGIDENDPSQMAAIKMVDSRSEMAEKLRQIRRDRGLTLQDVEESFAVDRDELTGLENQGVADTFLLIRYALAIGATVTFNVEEWPDTDWEKVHWSS